jgi:hypothetical protein
VAIGDAGASAVTELEARLLIGIAAVLVGVQFLAYRRQWSGLVERNAAHGTPTWYPRLFPYIGLDLGRHRSCCCHRLLQDLHGLTLRRHICRSALDS